MRLVIIFFALIMVVTYVSGSIDNARCSIEGIEDVKGVCLDNRHCEIWENLKKNLTITEIKKFKRCDSEDEEMLCCLNKKDVEKVLNIFSNSIRSENVITVRSVENIEETSSKDIKGNDETCLTKEKGIEGICVSLESCDYLFYKSQINPNSYDLIEARVEKCQRIVGKPYCCGIIENVNFRRNSLSTDPPKMTTEFSSSQYDNDTPCGRSGTCKLYKDCPYLKNRIKGIENNDDERNFLNENFCHYFQSKPYYCCDIQENERTTTKASYINISTTRNDLILDGTTTLRIVANEPEFDSCGENALCKPLQECDYLKYVEEYMQFQEKLDFFDNRRCSTSSGKIHLCCSIDERKQMNTKVLPNVIPQYEIIQAIPYSFCKDPNGANGFCAADCPSLNQTLRSIKSKSAQNDNFRERFCGYSRLAKPHYCCVPSPNRQIKISKNAEIVSPDHCTINDLKGYCIGLKHSGYLLNYYTESKLNQDSNRRKMRIFLAKIKCEPSVRHQIYANYVCSLHSKTDQNHYIQIIDEILNSDASCQTDERTGICRSLENCDYANRSYDKLSNEKARNDLLEYKKCSPREWQSQSTNDHYVCCISSESENDLIKKFKYPRTDEKNFCRYDNETEGICLSLDKCAYLEDQYKKNKLQGNFMNDVGCNPIDPLTGENFVCCNQVENENFLYVPVTGLTNCGNDGQADIGSGEDTNFYEFPWTVQIFHQLNIVCGGTLINEEAVLTSNSCVGNYSANDLTVRLGDWDISKEKDCDDSYYADPLYNDCADAFKDAKAKMILKHKESDIALVQLNEKVTNTKHIIPICLDKYNLQSFSNNELVSVGWGIKKNFETMSTIKRKSIIKIEEIGNHTFTAGGKKAMDTCQNDIGGGLVRFDQNKKLWFLVGVYSNGAENCENDRKPAVYVDVAKHYKWIEKSYQKMQGRFSQWRQILSKWC